MTKKQKKSQTGGGEPRRSWREVSTLTGGPGKAWTGVAAPVLLVVMVLVAAAVVFWPRGTDTTAPAPDSSATSSTSNEGGVCPPVKLQKEETPPADLTWTAVAGTAWPVSASAGPTQDVDGVAQCFDRSPAGAALAAVNASVALRMAGVDDAHRLLDAVYVDNKGRDVASRSIDELYPGLPPANRPASRQMGYEVLAFNDELARVLLVEDFPGAGQYRGTTFTLRWVDGDWKIELEDSGNPSDPLMITVDPDGFTRWSDTP